MSSMKKQEEQTKNICLLKKDGFTLYLVKEGDSFTDIKNGVVSILPEELIAKRKSGGNISTDIENYAHKLKRQEYGKKLNYQIENLLFLTGAGSSYLFGENDKKGKLMCNLWDDATVLLGGKQNMDAFCEKVRYTDKDEKDEYRKNLEKVLSLAEKAKDYIRSNTLDLESDNRMDSTGYVQYAISEAKAYAAIAIAEEGMRQKAIEAFKFAVDGYFIIGGTDYSADRLNEFIKKLES